MLSTARIVAGFFAAPVIPAAILLGINLARGLGDASIVLPLFLLPIACIATIIFGIPTYAIFQRMKVNHAGAYLGAGILLGPLSYLMFAVVTAYPGTTAALLLNSAGQFAAAAMYAGTAAVIFWAIAIRP